MPIIEYPKALYRNGAYMAAADQNEETEANADGWTDWHSDVDRMAAEAAKPARGKKNAPADGEL